MSNLLGQLKKVQQQRAAAPQGGQVDKLRSMLSTKATGRAGQTSGPRSSNVMEQAAIGEQQAQAQQLQQQGEQQVAGQQLQQQAQQQQFDQKSQAISQQREANLAEFNRKADNIARDLERADLSRAGEREQFDLAILGQTQALQDRKYMDELAREGQRRRLNDSITFKEELQKSVFADQQSLLSDDFAFKRMMDMDQRNFQREVAKIDLASAEELVRNDIAASNQRMVYEGMSSVASGGLQAYSAYDSAQRQEEANALKKQRRTDKVVANTESAFAHRTGR